MTCTDAQPLIARYADDESSQPAQVHEALDAHLGDCPACRAALAEQREVAGLLRARLETVPQPGLVARVSARIDAGHGARDPGSRGAGEPGILGLANWRGWAVGMVPLAAALFAAAYIDLRGAATSGTAQTVAATFEEWTAESAPALLQPSATGDALIETVLIGAAPSAGDRDVR